MTSTPTPASLVTPHVVAAGGRLPDLPAQLRRRERRRHRRPARHHLARAVPRAARHRRRLAEPVLPLGARRRRLRRRRLPRRRPAHRHARRLRRDGRGPARGGHQASSSTSCRTTPPTGTSGSERRSLAEPGSPGARPLHLPRRPRRGRRTAARRLGVACSAAPPGPASATASGTCTSSPPEQPDFNWDNEEVRDDFLQDAAVLGGPGRRRVPRRRRARASPRTCRRDPAHAGRAGGASTERRHAPAVGPRRGPRDLRRLAQVFDEYDPPRIAVAEAWVATPGGARYASADGLGQAFNFDLLEADFDADAVPDDHHGQPRAGRGAGLVHHLGVLQPRRGAPRDPLRAAAANGEHRASRQRAWLLSRRPKRPLDDVAAGPAPRPRRDAAHARACPAAPTSTRARSSACGEVADIPDERAPGPGVLPQPRRRRRARRLPRSAAVDARRARRSGSAGGSAHLPQPAWFAELSVEAEDGDPARRSRSTARLGAAARAADRESLTWVPADSPTSCTSRARTAGTSWRTSARTGAELPAGRSAARERPGRRPGDPARDHGLAPHQHGLIAYAKRVGLGDSCKLVAEADLSLTLRFSPSRTIETHWTMPASMTRPCPSTTVVLT